MFTDRRSRIRSAFIGAAVILAVAGGCANPVDRLIDSAMEKVVENVAESAIEDALGVELDELISGNIPADFPDVPLPNLEPISALKVGEEGARTWTAMYVVNGTADYEWVTSELLKRGYTEEISSAAGATTVSGYRGEDYFVIVSTIADDQAEALQIIVSEEE